MSRDDVGNQKKYDAIKAQESHDAGHGSPRHNQDEYDVIQAQQEWDQKTEVSVPTDNLTTVDINRSPLSKHVNTLFTEQYAVNPLQPAGQLVKTWMMLHDEVQVIIKDLEAKVAGLEADVADEKLKEPEEYHYTS